MQKLSTEALYEVNGGDKDDYDLGYRIGAAAKTVYNAVVDAWNYVVNLF